MKVRKTLLVSGLAVAINLLVLHNPAYARSTTLVDPAVVQLDCTLSLPQMEKAINSGLNGRAWTYKLEQPGHIEGRVLVRGKHTLWVDILYTGTSFDINYKDSDNLNYRVKDDGTRILHPNGNSWMENIRNDIRNHAAAMCP